jgi:quercetin dioxygenase-like cupin family protein
MQPRPASRTRPFAAFAIASIVLVTGALAVSAATDEREPIRRTIWGQTAPVNAPGQEMILQRVVIDPGAKLPEHFHEGTQLATIRSGVLTYNVASGSVGVTRADGTTETVTAPGVVELRAGDTIVEDESLVHYGANTGKKPVVIELVALLHEGAPLSTATGDQPGTTPLHLAVALTSQSRVLYEVGPAGRSTYGWNQLGGSTELDGAPVTVEMLGNVNYTMGSGPLFGFVTFTFADGSSIGVSMQGRSAASGDTADATFAATLGVIGGTGAYVDVSGFGTFSGNRTATLGGQVDAVFDLQLSQQEG